MKRTILKSLEKEITKIEAAGNMIEVKYIIRDAALDFFKMRNWGLEKINARKSGTLEQWEEIKIRRQAAFETNGNKVRSYLKTFIPERLHKSEMYKNLAY